MAPLAVPLLVAGVGIQAFGQYQAGEEAKRQAESDQAMAEYNAAIKERQAQAELARSRVEAQQFQEQGQRLQAAQRVGFAKGGVLSTTGTPMVTLEETAAALEADRKRILEEGFLAESFRRSEAEGLRYQGRAAAARGSNMRSAYRIGAVGSILTGIGTIGTMGGFGSSKLAGSQSMIKSYGGLSKVANSPQVSAFMMP